jgi:DNA polymerase-3 subunit beta
MKIKLNAEELSKKLEQVSRVVPSKTTIQILEDVLIEPRGDSIVITASDSEMWFSVKCEITECDGSERICVRAEDLASLIKNIGDRQVSITSDSNTCTLTCEYGNGSFSIHYDNADCFPIYREAEDVDSIIIDSSIILKSIEATKFASADNDKLRPVLNGIHIDIRKERIVTTAASISMVAIYSEKGVFSPDGKDCEFTLTKKSSNILTSILGTVKGNVKLSFNKNSISVNNSDFKLYSVLVDYKYPDCSMLIPTESKLVVTIDKESLLLALKRITPASNDISNSILFSFSEGNLTLSADNAVFGKSAKETVPCDCEGCMNICFKGSNVIDILRNIDDNDIVMEFTDENKAGVFYSMFSHTKDEYISMCMPMLIQ